MKIKQLVACSFLFLLTPATSLLSAAQGVFGAASYSADVVFAQPALYADDYIGISFDGTHYWTGVAGVPGHTSLAELDSVGTSVYSGTDKDYRSVFSDQTGAIFVRLFNDNVIYKQGAAGVFTPYVTVAGPNLGNQMGVVLNAAGTEYIAWDGSSVYRWDLTGAYLGSSSLVMTCTLSCPVLSVGNLWLTYDDSTQTLSAWDNITGVLAGQTVLTGASTGHYSSSWSLSYANGRVFVADNTSAGKWRGYPVVVGPPVGASPSAPPPLQITPLGSMSISVVPNQSLLATGTVTVVANQSGTWTATTSAPWLSLTQSSGGFPGTVAATANAVGLAAGSYAGGIAVAGTAAGGAQTISIPVTLTVNSPAALTANPTALSMASSYPAGSATGFAIQTGAAGLAFTVSTSASSAGWLTVSPASGIAPTPITVTLDPSKATPGTYTDSIVVSSAGVASVTVPVKMAVSGFMATLPQQVNAATQAGPDHTVAPNELVTLYLTDFSCATAPVISINGTAVSWSSYSGGQLNYAVPANITQPAALTVACNGTTSWTFNGLTTAAVVPGIFTLAGNGKGQADVVNSDGTINGSANPATRGSWLAVYGTGFGTFNAAGTNGLRTVAGAVTATLGGVDAPVLYAGSAPGAPDGVQQFNLQIPAGATAGTAVPVVLTVNGTPTQSTATVSLK